MRGWAGIVKGGKERLGVIVNPVAGRGRGLRVWRLVQPALADCFNLEARFTEAAGAARDLEREMQAGGWERIAVLGGDGTLHEAVNGLDPGRCTLGLIPGGTGNDFSRSLGIPRDPLAAVRVLAAGRVRALDLGVVNGERFLNVAGVGFDAEVAAEINKGRRRLSGAVPYVAAALKLLINHQNREVTVWLDGAPRRLKAFLVAVGNAQYYGGGMRITPAAVLDDGWFSVCLAGDVSRLDILRTLPLVFSGRHVRHPLVATVAAREVRIDSAWPLAIHADGEIIGTLPADFSILPGALRFIAP